MRAVGMVAVLALVAGILTATGAFLAVAPAGAANATILVTTTADTVNDTDGVLSLREAVALANQQSGADAIQLSVPGPYALTRCGVVPGGVLDATDPAGLAISGGATVSACAASGLRFSAGAATVTGLTLTGPGGRVVLNGTAAPAAATPLHLSSVTIDGPQGHCVEVTGRAAIELSATKLRNCDGSGLLAPASSVHMMTSEISGTAGVNGVGAGSFGEASIDRSVIQDNLGGGVTLTGGATITKSHFDRNAGGSVGGLAVLPSAPFQKVYIEGSTIDDNTSTTWGGLTSSATTDLLLSSVSRNTLTNGSGAAGVALRDPVGTGSGSIYLQVAGSHVDDNVSDHGVGGLSLDNGPGHTNGLLVKSSSFDRNKGALVSALRLQGGMTTESLSAVGNEVTVGGGTILTSGTIVIDRAPVVELHNSTIANNTTKPSVDATPIGGAINGIGVVKVHQSTLTGNAGDVGGIVAAGAGSLIDRSTIVDNVGTRAAQVLTWDPLDVTGSAIGSSAPSAIPACVADGPDAAITSKGFNFDSAHSCGFGPGPAGAPDITDGGNPKLGPLGDNGGDTRTRLPDAGSPLVDRIPTAAYETCTGVDQRDTQRPQGLRCDIGAVEGSVGARFHPVAPTRLLDSRTGTGGWESTPLTASQPRPLVVTGGAVPATASAVVVNVTATGSTAPSFLTVFPAGGQKPNASNLNFAAGQTIPNLVTATVGAGGAISLATAAGATDVVVDLVGWFDDGSGAGAGFTPVTPARLLDSRTTNGGWHAKLAAGAPRDLVVGGRGGVPTSAVAAIVNITATESSSATFLTAWPTGQPKPGTSNVNAAAGQTIPNLAVVPLGAGGSITLATALGQVDVIVDVVGYYDAGGARFHPIAPTRILDDRVNVGAVGPWGPNQTRLLSVGTTMTAIVANVTATNATLGTYITAFPKGEARPVASNLNVGPGQTIPNLVVVGVVDAGGQYGNGFQLHNALGSVDLIADVSGYYTSS